jgi:predicted nucleotidyltransferase
MQTLIEQKHEELILISRRHRVRKLAVFGSAVTGGFRDEDSDVDFTVEFEPMTAREHARSYFGLLRDLELLLSRRIDLIEKSSVRNPYIRQDIERTEQVVYAT